MTEQENTQPGYQMTPQQYAAKVLAKELADMKAAGVQPDKIAPGGRYLGTNGQLHDAEGRPITDGGEMAKASAESNRLQAERTRREAIAAAKAAEDEDEPKTARRKK